MKKKKKNSMRKSKLKTIHAKFVVNIQSCDPFIVNIEAIAYYLFAAH